MAYSNIEIESANVTDYQLADILSGFKEVLNKSGASDSTAIQLTIVDQKLEKKAAIVLPEGCKHKCWYSKATSSTECGIVCSI